MKCNHCNFEVAEGMKFCPKCGNPISNHDGMKQPNANRQDVSSKKRNWFISAAILVAIILGLFLLKGSLTSKVNLSEIGECYDINGVQYPSYSQLKYIAMNELSHDEVKEVMAICGINQIEASGGLSKYRGECGIASLLIMDGDYISYEFSISPKSKKYMEMLKSDLMLEEDFDKEKTSTADNGTLLRYSGYINDYFLAEIVCVFDRYNDSQFSIRFRHSTKKKFTR